MARGVNKVVLIGTLGRDPDCRTLPGSNTSVATFSIATNEHYKDQSGVVQTRTEWHRLVLWNGLANIARQYLRKGSLVYVEGKLRTRSYDDKDGVKRYVTEIYVSELEMLGGNPNGASQPNNNVYLRSQIMHMRTMGALNIIVIEHIIIHMCLLLQLNIQINHLHKLMLFQSLMTLLYYQTVHLELQLSNNQ